MSDQQIIQTQNQTTQPAPQPSALQLELQKLYARDGREMPPMNMSDLPAAPPSGRQSPATNAVPTAPPQQAEQKQGLLSRILPFGKKDEPPRTAQRPATYTPPPMRPAVPAAPAATYQTPANSFAEEPAESSEFFPGVEAVAAPAQPPADRQFFEQAPFVQTPAARQQPAAPQLQIMTPERPAAPEPSQTAQTGEEFPDPFTEMSEAEADGDEPSVASEEQPANPYTGLTLDNSETKRQMPFDLEDAPEEEVVESEPRQPPVLDLTEPAKKPERGPRIARPDVPQPRIADRQPPQPLPVPPNPADAARKMQKIAERAGLTGFKGFCPVALRERRDLVDSLAAYHSTYEGRTYFFSSSEAKAKFDARPEQYAPVSGGNDVILLGNSGQEVEGTLEYAVWYKDRLHLFSSPQTKETFVQTINYSNEAP